MLGWYFWCTLLLECGNFNKTKKKNINKFLYVFNT